MQSLAIKYRPKTWEDVTEQSSAVIILKQQLESGEIKNAYLFCGPAGCGKTTCARIFASDLNKGQGNPIELDAASNNSVDDVREIIQQAKTQSLNSEYKVFIIDECHALSNSAWQAMLKLIEEPPAKSVFIFCTTDPQKIPKTIISRVQRYDFQRISQKGIVDRLLHILCEENEEDNGERGINDESVAYIAKIADGGMRDAITMLDKCLAYSRELTLENVVKALGAVEYDCMFKFTDAFIEAQQKELIQIIEQMYADGKDLKQFVGSYVKFLLDVCKYSLSCPEEYIGIPMLADYKQWLDDVVQDQYSLSRVYDLLDLFVKLNSAVRYSTMIKYEIEAVVIKAVDLVPEE